MNKNSKKLLIVDDQINMLSTLKFIFEDKGFDVTMVASGPEAIDRVKKNFYKVVLLDINMPEMDGFETFKRIKKISPETRVIMMTGNKESAQIKKSLKEGAYTVVYKPFDIEQLIKLMKEGLDRPVVLVVDDRREDRTILKDTLEMENFRVIEARDGQEALEKVKQGDFDVCLVDFKMPGMDGVETIEEIKKFKKEMGVIMMSGYSMEETLKSKIEDEEELPFLKKPYDIDSLLGLMSSELKKKKDKDTK